MRDIINAIMLVRGSFASLVLCLAAWRAAAAAALLDHMQIHRSQGAAGPEYEIQSVSAADTPLFVDRPWRLGTALPQFLSGATRIATSDADSALDAGSDTFLSFTVASDAAVYVAYDETIAAKPQWLTRAFLDTGEQVTLADGPAITRRFELYVNYFRGGSNVVLGANVAAHSDSVGHMYGVFVTPAAQGAAPLVAPHRPAEMCSTPTMVGLRWRPAGNPTDIAAYRIVRDDIAIAVMPPTLSQYTDSTVAPASAYVYRLVALDRSGNSATSPPLALRTPGAVGAARAPYCPSPYITSMQFRFARAYSETRGEGPDEPPASDGSDLWSLTTGADGNTYTFFGDGWGLCGHLDADPVLRRQEYTSLGFARISGPMPLRPAHVGDVCPTQFSGGNIYGGYRSLRRYGAGRNDLINGKASGLIAVGERFYALGGIWRAGDTGGPRSSPNHWELVYSLDGGLSWEDNASWSFCTEDNRGAIPAIFQVNGGRGGICASGFVNFGPGNRGAPDGFVYLYATENKPILWGKPSAPGDYPNRTYLLRVPPDQVLEASAYRYFAGLDANGAPLWSDQPERRVTVFTDPNPPRDAQPGSLPMYMVLAEAVYNTALRRYIATAQGEKVSQVAFYEAPNLWGPWSVIYYSNIDAPGGRGGWGNLGSGTWDGARYRGSGSLGVHIGNAWTSPDGRTLWLVFSSDGRAPREALFKQLAGRWLDSFNVVEARLRTHGPPRALQ